MGASAAEVLLLDPQAINLLLIQLNRANAEIFRLQPGFGARASSTVVTSAETFLQMRQPGFL